MKDAEQDLRNLIAENEIDNGVFKPVISAKVRFLQEHRWDKIMNKMQELKNEGVYVEKTADANSLRVKGTSKGKKKMIEFLDKKAGGINSKTFPLSKPGMKKQMSLDATNTIISGIEKNHNCVIEKIMAHDLDEAKDDFAVAEDDHKPDGKSSMNLPFDSMSYVNDKAVKITSGQRITIAVGDIAKEKVDVIVNSTNEKMDLNANPVGKALLKVAGNDILEECKKIGEIKVGGVVVTGGGKLNCKSVYHVCLSEWQQGDGAKVLRSIVKNCVTKSESQNFHSIAFPAIGTGNLKFPRSEVVKIFFEEVASYFTVNPQSKVNNVRFVTYGGDKQTVVAFLGAVEEMKPILSATKTNISSHDLGFPGQSQSAFVQSFTPSSATTSENSDGSLEVKGGGVAKALVKAGGDKIKEECKALGTAPLFSTQYTGAGKLLVNQIAHVIGPGKPSYQDLKKCLDNFFDDLSGKGITDVSFSAIGAGAMGFSERESVTLIFDNISRMALSKNPTLNLVRIVIFEKGKFDQFKDATKKYFSSEPEARRNPKKSSKSFKFCKSKIKVKAPEASGLSVKIFSDDMKCVESGWSDFLKRMKENLKKHTICNETIKKFGESEKKKISEVERNFDVTIKIDFTKGEACINGNVKDFPKINDELGNMFKEIEEKENSKVPDYWETPPDDNVYHAFELQPKSDEYMKVKNAFDKTASNEIVKIERIQNQRIYEVYNVKRKAMKEKYGDADFADKEKQLFHGTSKDNVEKINSGGLNRNFAGKNAIAYGKGVYFARDASYSLQEKFSPKDANGLRYVYYARVLVGDYAKGNPTMLVPPSKNTADPNETYDSVVDDTKNPSIFVMFKDYQYYTEYLITFK
ncbi:protein mono-ADP-ribosyltransferase PARP15-like [Xenia sp. Carnegie-2017]|uniref:protein mono-ADP-ribosyltransferase PARP15-like n=1 Tax=Xenia sp. Carnegie-2017 TaxID=2897299 RepID=UPI001F04A83A|nr:protein mono-ADP-ribosyltransferase PARP15-like [Xenia sp. Carnegie-2017]